MDLPHEVFEEVLLETSRIHQITAFKPIQKLCIRRLIEGRDVLACLTGFGKSLVAWPTVCRLHNVNVNIKLAARDATTT